MVRKFLFIPYQCHSERFSSLQISVYSASLRYLFLSLFISPPSQTSLIRRLSLPASPHYSPPSPPTILPALPSPRSRSYRWQRPHLQRVCFRSPAPSRSGPLATRHSPLPPYRSPALPARAPQTPSSSAAPPNRSIRSASRILSTSCTGSAAPSLPCAPPW